MRVYNKIILQKDRDNEITEKYGERSLN